ncbi:MAG: ATP-binding protein [Gammaproteobacteria bacterium]
MYQEPPAPNRGPLRNMLDRLTMPIDDWAREGSERGPSYLLVLMGMLLVSLIAAALVTLAWWGRLLAPGHALVALLGALALAAALLLMVMYQVQHHLLRPLSQLYSWAVRMCDGEFGARIPPAQDGRFAKLTYHINRLSEALEDLANEMDATVSRQTERLRAKNESLKVLSEIASAINVSEDVEELLSASARILMKTTGAHAMAVRLRDGDARMRTIAAEGAPSGPSARDAGGDDVEFLTGLTVVPLRYMERTYGDISLYTDAASQSFDPELRELLANVGKDLGMAVAKARLDEETHKLSLMRERTALAHELHDSLAQTLAGLGFQVKMLAETLTGEVGTGEVGTGQIGTGQVAAGAAGPCVDKEIESIQLSLDEANTELRELIANFRAPVDGDGMNAALQALVERSSRQSTMTIFAQTDGPVDVIPAGARLQVLRIVREALSNACKHSGARTARVLLRVSADGDGHLLIEDDGSGIDTKPLGRHPGEQIGLSIMDERTRRLGGHLRIDSEPGEGTQVTVTFRVPPAARIPAEAAGSRAHAS